MALTNREILHTYLRHDKRFPHIWCPGCGNGIVLSALLRAVNDLGWEKDEVALISGIGCAGRAPVYVDFNTVHTAHGRALPFATGIKAVKPRLKVVVLMGDGDAVGIGGNHFIHACRRNIDITAIVVNNATYGMTGGQSSPTTPVGGRTATAVGGVIETPFDLGRLAEGAGATFVARSTSYHARQAEEFIKRGFLHKGFSVVEIITGCHTNYGRRNDAPDPVTVMKSQKESAISLEKAKGMTPDELSGRIVTGILVDREAPEWTDQYDEVRRRAQAAKAGEEKPLEGRRGSPERAATGSSPPGLSLPTRWARAAFTSPRPRPTAQKRGAEPPSQTWWPTRGPSTTPRPSTWVFSWR